MFECMCQCVLILLVGLVSAKSQTFLKSFVLKTVRRDIKSQEGKNAVSALHSQDKQLPVSTGSI